MHKVNPFLARTAPFPPMYFSNLFIAFNIILLTNSGKLSPAKAIATSVSGFLPKLAKQEPNDLPD